MTPIRRILLAALALLGAGVGGWALLAPASFYAAFPGAFFGAWVGVDGPFNEHLIRDVGALYLALAAASVVGAISRRADAGRGAAVAWIVFSVPHLVYHLEHLAGLAPLDAVSEPIALALTIVLPIPLLLPGRRRSAAIPSTTHAEEAQS